MLNRSALIVRPREPFLEWAASLDDSGLAPDADDEQTVYLVPGYEDDDEAMEVLAQAYEPIFEEELYGWHTEESDWPANRTFETFLEWFDVEFYSIVEDLCAYPIMDDDDDTDPD